MTTKAIVREIKVIECGASNVISCCILVNHNEKEHIVHHTEEQFAQFKLEFYATIPDLGVLEYFNSKEWTKCQCKLAGSTFYFVSKKSKKSNPLEQLDLFDVHSIASRDAKKGIFEIYTSAAQTVMTFKASSEMDMEVWIKRLASTKQALTNPLFPQGANVELEMKKARLTHLLTDACQHTSEIVNKFLMIDNNYKGERYPQFKMLLVPELKCELLKDLHENYGVPLNFTHHAKLISEDPTGQPFLSWVCSLGNYKLVEYILTVEPPEKVNEMISQKDSKSGKTPLHYACTTSPQIANLLISRGATSQLCLNGSAPLHYLVQAADSSRDVTLLDSLTKKMVLDINLKDTKNGYTPLHYCCTLGYLDMLPILLQNGASCYVCDNTGKTVLHHLAVNRSTKAFTLMGMLLSTLLKDVIDKLECTKQINLMDLRDNTGLTAIQYALQHSSCSRHITLLQQHRTKLEDSLFSMLIDELMYYEPSSTFPNIADYLSLQINDYHSNIKTLIERALRLNQNISNILDEKPPELKQLLTAQVAAQFCPIFMYLCALKNQFQDHILTSKLQLFKANVNYKGFGIKDAVWNKMSSGIDAAKQSLAAMSQMIDPKQKLNCLTTCIHDICNCEGMDENFPGLLFLMVYVSDLSPSINWNAEIEYITTLDPEVSILFLVGAVMYFSDATMHRTLDGTIVVECVDIIVVNTIQDLKVLWTDIKKEPNALKQLEKIHSIFLQCANNLSGTNEVVLHKTSDSLLADYVENNHFWQKIVDRIQFQFIKHQNGNEVHWRVRYSSVVELFNFSKIESSFSEIK